MTDRRPRCRPAEDAARTPGQARVSHTDHTPAADAPVRRFHLSRPPKKTNRSPSTTTEGRAKKVNPFPHPRPLLGQRTYHTVTPTHGCRSPEVLIGRTGASNELPPTCLRARLPTILRVTISLHRYKSHTEDLGRPATPRREREGEEGEERGGRPPAPPLSKLEKLQVSAAPHLSASAGRLVAGGSDAAVTSPVQKPPNCCASPSPPPPPPLGSAGSLARKQRRANGGREPRQRGSHRPTRA